MKPSRLPRVLLFPAALVALTQCQEKEQPAAAKGSEVIEDVAKVVAEVVESESGLGAEERAAVVPVAALARGDVDAVASLIDPKGAVDRLGELKMWDFIRSVAMEEEGTDPEEAISEVAAPILPFVSEDLSVIYGKGASEFFDLYLQIGKRMNYYQFRSLSQAFAQGIVSGDLSTSMEAMGGGAPFEGIIGEVEKFLPQLQQLRVPPIVFASKISDESARQQAMDQIGSLFSMAAPQGEAVSFASAGSDFNGFKFSGEPIAQQIEANPEDLIARFGPETTQRLIDTIREKTVVVANAVVGDYVMVYVGGDTESCPLTGSLEESLAANDRIAFIDGYKDLPVHGFLYGAKELIEATFQTDSFTQIAAGVVDGLREVEGFGDPRELISLLGLVEEKEKALYSFYKPETVGGVISVDHGVSFDLFGGYESGALRNDAPHHLESLGEGENTLLFADAVVSPEYQKALSEYIDLLVTITYSAAEHVAGLTPANDKMAQYQQMFTMFDESFRNDLLKLWNGIMLADQGLGDERAFVVDVSGAVPSLPGVPPAVVENGRMPRMTYLAPVSDRSKLADSWKEIDTSVRSLLATARDLGAGDLNMLVPTNSEKNDLVTWYFDAAAFSDDLKPSVTVSDQWFAASTSRTHALDLIGKAAAAGEGERTGAWLKLDTDVLAAYLSDLVTLVDEQGEDIIPDPGALEEFRARLPMIRDGIKAFEELDAITIHEREENGRRRATFRITTD
ncbi:hypothetical protein [Haloferula sargassicola]|uniref:DUF3352 domain-containing protein n=1 Tax=Haloferula sargassicola TaxID=490096 RepID=A0ABP9UI80_9BACT